MLVARGEFLLMVDADGATKFSDLGKLLLEIKKIEKNGQGVVVGSRSHLVTTEAVVKVIFPFFGIFIFKMTYILKMMPSSAILY